MVYSPTPISGPLGWGWGGRPPKRSRTLEKSRVLWCGKQDLNPVEGVNSEQSCIIMANIKTKNDNNNLC